MRVLLVDDNPDDRLLVRKELAREFGDLDLVEAGTPQDLARGLDDGPWDVVITDYQLHAFDGLRVLQAVKARDAHCPVIMFTGTGSEEIAVTAMKGGLQDYVLKSPSHVKRLAVAVRMALEHRRQREAADEAERARRRTAEELLQRNADLERLNQRLAVLSSRLIDAQESERRLLARELHDEIGQALTAVKLCLHGAAGLEDRASLAAAFCDATAIVDQALAQVRSLSLSLRPSILDDLGLAPAARWLLESQIARVGLQFDSAIDLPEARLPREVETNCFRVLQEAVTNVVRHARAARLSVTLSCAEGQLRLEVRDDGAGFDVAAALARAGQGESLGLLSMQERVHMTGGHLEVDSGPGGTTVRARWPVDRPIPSSPARRG